MTGESGSWAPGAVSINHGPQTDPLAMHDFPSLCNL